MQLIDFQVNAGQMLYNFFRALAKVGFIVDIDLIFLYFEVDFSQFFLDIANALVNVLQLALGSVLICQKHIFEAGIMPLAALSFIV